MQANEPSQGVHSQSGFSYKMEQGVAVITINYEDDAVNTLKKSSLVEIETILAEITAQPNLKGLVFISGKPSCFVAGADIEMINECSTEQQAQQLALTGQQLFKQINSMPVPVVAAINGACLGGGLELALACHGRVIADNSKTVLALPEVKLGLLPGSGGTQRLPQLIGLSRALKMMLTGQNVQAKKALSWGLADDLVPESILLACAFQLLERLNSKTKMNVKFSIDSLLALPKLKTLFLNQAKKQVLKQTKGHYPAPLKIIELLEQHACGKGYTAEAEFFGHLVMTPESQALRHLFFASTGLKKSQNQKYQSSLECQPISQVAIVGGGLMGAGIATVTVSRAKMSVRLKETSQQSIQRCKSQLNALLLRRIKRKQIRPIAREQALNLLTTCSDYSGFKHRDIVIEAVFEDLTLKQQILTEVEQHTQPNAIFASNTSSIPIHAIAEQAARPQNVIGLHYFSPVEKMPLVEVIPHKGSSAHTISQTLDFARRQGKTPIVVKDCAGFYVNRILAPYIKATLSLLKEGVAIEAIDNAMVKLGFPLGPCRLLDQVGIDIAAKIGPMLTQELGARFSAEPLLQQMVEQGYLGKKSGQGFYFYKKEEAMTTFKKLKRSLMLKPKKSHVAQIDLLLGVSCSIEMSDDMIQQRCLQPMLDEARLCLEEGIISSAADGDIGAVFGMGFPPFLGGPFFYSRAR